VQQLTDIACPPTHSSKPAAPLLQRLIDGTGRQIDGRTPYRYIDPVFENTYFSFFSDFKKHDFLRFFEMTYQKVVKSHQQKFSPHYVTKE